MVMPCESFQGFRGIKIRRGQNDEEAHHKAVCLFVIDNFLDGLTWPQIEPISNANSHTLQFRLSPYPGGQSSFLPPRM